MEEKIRDPITFSLSIVNSLSLSPLLNLRRWHSTNSITPFLPFPSFSLSLFLSFPFLLSFLLPPSHIHLPLLFIATTFHPHPSFGLASFPHRHVG